MSGQLYPLGTLVFIYSDAGTSTNGTPFPSDWYKYVVTKGKQTNSVKTLKIMLSEVLEDANDTPRKHALAWDMHVSKPRMEDRTYHKAGLWTFENLEGTSESSESDVSARRFTISATFRG
jgi:hypothetical protein